MAKENIFSIPEEIANVVKTLENKDFEAYLVGGCVRDLLIGIKPKDWDVTTNATPEEIIKAFPKTFYENEYGTVGVVNESTEDPTLKVVEVTPYRLESKYSNRRHPDEVKFGKKLEEDLDRRDFTINAIALKLELKQSIGHGKYKGHIIDPHKGHVDISKKTLRTVGNPDERFAEDALRIMRAVRIATELDFLINKETEEAIRNNAKHLSHVSCERIRDEFIRILLSERPMYGIMLCHEYGILKLFLPEIEEGIGVKQNKAHAYDVWEHLLRTLQHAAKNKWSLNIRLAALLHDVAKPAVRLWSEEKKDWTFHGHDVVGGKMATKILARLMFPMKTIDTVVKLIRWHMFFSDTDQITLSSVRRLLRNVGVENIWDLMNVRACDRIGTGRPKEHPYRLRKYKAMIEEVMHDPVTVGMLKIDGSKVMEVANISPGPKIGHILHALLEEVMEDPKLNTPEYLGEKALEFSKMSEKDLEQRGHLARMKKEAEEQEAIKKIRDKYWVK